MGLRPIKEITVLQPNVYLSDPHVWSDNRDCLSVRWAIYEPLVYYGEGGQHQPALAKSWVLADDARTWTFRLRAPVTFHNGDALTAQDVVASLERARDPKTAGELGTGRLYQSYLGGAEIEALDEHTVRIVLREPMADLLDLLMDIPIVAQSGLDSLPDVHVGSGPYRIVEAGSDRAQLEGFSEHWGGRPPIDTVHWRAEPHEDHRVEALLTGEADLVTEVSVWSKQKIDSYEPTKVVASQHGMCVIFMCNARSGVCADKRVRQALNYALDVAEIIDKVKGGAARPLNGPLTSLHFGYDPATPPYPYDPVEAKRLLAEAGYADGLQLTLDIPTSMPDEAPHLAQIMFQQFSRVGITTKVNVISDRPNYADMVRNKQIHDACCFDSTPLSSCRVLREKLHSGLAGPWWQGYSSRAFDQLIDQAQVTPDSRQRQELYRRAYRIVREDAPWIFFYNPILFWGLGRRAHGWEPGIEGLVRLA